MPPLHKNHLPRIGQYVLAGLLSVLTVTCVMELWRANLRVPFTYAGDAVVYSTFIKGIIDNGWYYHNDLVGQPSGLHMYDFPLPDNFHFLVIKLLCLFSSDHALVLNIFFLLTFPLTTLASLYVFQQFKISYLPALLGSLLYTFLPYHLFRGEGHLFYSAYYMVPLMVLVILWTYSGKLQLVKRENGKTKFGFRSWRAIFALLAAIVTASSGAYYAFFACFLLLVGGILAVAEKRVYSLLTAVILVLVMSVTLAVNLSPSFIYLRLHGNPQTMLRAPGEAEMFGLKIAQLLLPMSGHRMPRLAQLKARYNHAPLITENNTATLGLVGTAGFLLLLVALFCGRRPSDPSTLEAPVNLLLPLSKLNFAAVLFGTIGGFSSLFALLISPQLRSYNRISVYIGFFCLFAIVISLEHFVRQEVSSRIARIGFRAFVSLLLVVGILDQTSKIFIPPYANLNAEYGSNQNFISKVEQMVPANSMIFQLPYIPFPEHPPVNGMVDYDHFKAYLHSTRLRWSYGATKGREGDRWQKIVSSLPAPEFVETLALASFSGIYIDRNGYSDKGVAIESEISKLVGGSAIVSDNGRLAFFSLLEYSQRLREKYSEEEWLAKKNSAIYPLLVYWGGGFSELETSEQRSWRWSSAEGELYLDNTSPETRKIQLDMDLSTGHAELSDMRLTSSLFSDEIKISSEPSHYSRLLTIPPGRHLLKLSSNARRVTAPRDPRYLVFRVDNFQIADVK